MTSMSKELLVAVFCFLWGACTWSDTSSSERYRDGEMNHLAAVEEEQNNKWIVPNLDSIAVLSGLDSNMEVFPYNCCADFSYSFTFDPSEENVTIKSSGSLCGFALDYYIILHDEKGVYSPDSFYYGDVTFEYLKSFFVIDSIRLELIPDIVFANAFSEVVSPSFREVQPSLIWHGIDTYGGRCFKVGRRYFFVVQGLNLYCNGTACTSNQIFVIQLADGEASIDVFYLDTFYPYGFETFFLYDKNCDSIPEVLIPAVEQPSGVKDFEWYELRPDGARKISIFD